FDQAAKAEFDRPDAYHRLRESLLPRWGGSEDALLVFGRECLATKRYDTQVPWEFHLILRDLRADQAQWRDILSLPAVFDDYRTMLEGYRAKANDDGRNRIDSYLACVNWL